MRDEFDKLAAQGKISPKQIEALVALATSGFCHHRSWGFGQITTIDTVFARFLIDFPNRPSHQMDLGFAADSLKPIPKDHILARKASDLDGLRQMAALHHLDLIKLVLNSFGGKATVDQIQQSLVPDVIRDDWKKWWEAARTEMKKDGHFVLPLKKTEPLAYQSKEVSLQDRLMAELRSAKGLKARHLVATELMNNLNDLKDKQACAKEAILGLNAEIASYQRNQPSVALEAVFVRDELCAAIGTQPAEGEITANHIWHNEVKLSQTLEAVPAAKQRRMLLSFKEAFPDRWHESVLREINRIPAKLVSEFAHLLVQEHKLEDLKLTLARLISQHQASTELLLWLAKERSDAYADILGPEVFRAMLTAMERDQFNEKKSNRLRDFILSDQELLVELIGSADIEVIKDLTRALKLSPCFVDMDKRSLLARIVKSYPAIQSLISGESTKQDSTITVSWESLERRKNEYSELVQKKIPANSKEIAIARSYGDLRENHEYKAAKEMQKLLMRRKSELEQQLVKARGTDFANARTDVAGLGTRVEVTDLLTQQPETYTIMGAWDTEPEKHIISYLTPMAKALIGNAAGTDVEFDMNGVIKRYRINSIVLAPPLPPVTPVVAESAPAETDESVPENSL
ncbi:MAG: GreA/GreB family elongation factor [Verrucomicrobiota bacterium]